MSSRQQIDSVIDDDDEFCSIFQTRTSDPVPVDIRFANSATITSKPTAKRADARTAAALTMTADLALKHRKAAAAKKKEAEKREIEASSRKNLAGVRVVQKNLVYVIGLNPTIRDENQLLQTLRGKEYFGQYGDIEKIVVSKAKPGGNPHQGIGVYVTFSRKADAATCINAVDGSANGDRILRAQYGTTKYCSSFLRNEQCNNRNCTFLHETGEDSESYSRSDLSSMNTLSSQRQNVPQVPQPRPVQPLSHPMRRQPSKDDSISGRQSIPDGPALPSSASWANRDASIKARRPSLSGSQASQSPRPASVNVAIVTEESKRTEKPSPITQEAQRVTSQSDTRSPSSQTRPREAKPEPASPFDSLIKELMSPEFRFVFSASELPADELKAIENYPSFIDPYGGVKRRAMREKAEQDRLKREQELLQTASAEEESREAGSLQLGGEPEEGSQPRGRPTRELHGAIQPPSQQGTAENSTVGSPVSATSHQFQGLNLAGRSLTPLQQQQLMLLKSAGNQQAGLSDPLSSAALDQAAQVRQGLMQSQMAQFNALQAQSRQGASRFSFANEVGSKNMTNARMLSQMQSGTPNPLSAPSPQHAVGGGFYASGAQGPPPGLKTAGTPPISGGGMFAQGHGFTNNNVGLGSTMSKQDATPELMRELLRGRSATNIGGIQGQEAAKREFMFPFLQQHQTPPPLTPVNGLLSSFYGSQAGSAPDSGGSQKQKKKGKKQRHANTSSGGGGVVDLADPSILQARMHQVGVNATAGQALYGSQSQGGYNPSMMYGGVTDEFPPLGGSSKDAGPVDPFGFLKSQLPSESAGRVGTPTLPPGLPLPHAHPASAAFQEHMSSSKPASPAPIVPPGLSGNLSRVGTPSKQNQTSESRAMTPERHSRNASTSARIQDASQISLGSPIAKSAHKTRLHAKGDLRLVTDEKEPFSQVDQGLLIGTKESPASVSVPSATQEAASTKSERGSSGTFASAAGSTSAIGSRPNTPLTTASGIPESSATRQPRILRVVETPKPAPPPPVGTAPSVAASTTTADKSRSQETDRPDTPGDYGSEADFFPSTSASRANSPPASSRIGSAPVRSITKSQAKKERRQKAKEAEAKNVETVPVPQELVQAPIMGRKRKTKKATSTPTDSADGPAASVAESASPIKASVGPPKKDESKPEPPKKVKEKEQPVPEIKQARTEAPSAPPKPHVEEAWHSHNTVQQATKDAEESGRSIKDILLERTKPLHEILAQMHRSGSLDLNKSLLFNPVGLGQRTDMKCTADDYDQLKKPLELTEEHRKALRRGEPVHIGNGQLKNRCLITPRGSVLRHLEPEEEARYLQLEKQQDGFTDPFVVGDDSSNINGGLEALFATPEKYNIRWVDEPARLGATSPTTALTAALGAAENVVPPNVLSAMEADSTRNHDWAIAHSAELLQTTTDAVRSFAAATAKQILGTAGIPCANPSLEDVSAMTNEELKELSGRSQKDLESTRKEIDSLDKKFAALLRRNKKVQQQALAIVDSSS
ncbi:uncharacterized protein N7477_009741 [Penicillium maclennaniae]|uniref:uncharacterized protein n=1 Tax=Penicillium maclennaniae TaxID=1343394 RepID=UPI002541598A|nr:uncharacterized protein N7477_009741 [Penicillium maclennaniae]KAJ5662125.1 hypothetical protein N7477_009741 [Penicillium maclennaniae]